MAELTSDLYGSISAIEGGISKDKNDFGNYVGGTSSKKAEGTFVATRYGVTFDWWMKNVKGKGLVEYGNKEQQDAYIKEFNSSINSSDGARKVFKEAFFDNPKGKNLSLSGIENDATASFILDAMVNQEFTFNNKTSNNIYEAIEKAGGSNTGDILTDINSVDQQAFRQEFLKVRANRYSAKKLDDDKKSPTYGQMIYKSSFPAHGKGWLKRLDELDNYWADKGSPTIENDDYSFQDLLKGQKSGNYNLDLSTDDLSNKAFGNMSLAPKMPQYYAEDNKLKYKDTDGTVTEFNSFEEYEQHSKNNTADFLNQIPDNNIAKNLYKKPDAVNTEEGSDLLGLDKVEAPEEFQIKQPGDIYSEGNTFGNVEDEVEKTLNIMNNEEASDENYREGMGHYIKIRADIIKNGTDSRYWSERGNVFTEGEAANLQENGIQNKRRRGEFEVKTHMDWLAYQQHNKGYNDLTPQERKDLKPDPYEPIPEWIQKQKNPTGINKVMRDIYKTLNPNAGKVWNQTYDNKGQKVYVQKPPIGSIAHRSMEWKRPGYEGYDKQINVSHLKTMDDVVEKEIEPWVSKVEGKDVDIPAPLPTDIEKTTPITLEKKTVDKIETTDTEEPEIIKQKLTSPPTDYDDPSLLSKVWGGTKKIGAGLLGMATSETGIGLLQYAVGKKSLNKAMEDIPIEEGHQLDGAWQGYMNKMRDLSSRGLSAEERFAAQNDLSEAYQLGIKNVARASGGSRATFLAGAGVLNANRVKGLLKLNAMDQATHRQNLKQYGAAIQFQNTHDQREGEIDRKMAYDEAKRKSDIHGTIGATLIGNAFKTLGYATEKNANSGYMNQYLKNLDLDYWLKNQKREQVDDKSQNVEIENEEE
jgi:hypothetical protein